MQRRSRKEWTLCAVVVMLIALSWSAAAHAQRVTIEINDPAFQPLPIAVPNFKHSSAEQPQLAREMSQLLVSDLEFSGIFRALDPKGFLEDPQTMGVTAGEIRFPDWQRIGADYLVRAVYQVQGSSLKLEARLFNAVAGNMMIGKIYEGNVQGWKAMVHSFADEILFLLTGERGVYDTKIAFVQAQGKNKEIFVCDFDGSNMVQATNDRSIALSPDWNSDGTQLAYVSYKEGPPKLFIMNLMNGFQRLLSGFPGINISPSWRPGASDLAVTLSKDGTPDIYLVSSSGHIQRRLVQGFSINVSPDWSPDGRRLAYVSDESGSPQIYILDVGSGQKKRLTFSGNYNTSPSWSPKGDRIAFSGTVGGRHNIFTIKTDGSDLRQLTRGGGDNESPTWSPDSRMIAFSSTRDGASAIWVLWTNGTGEKRLTRLGGAQELPEWSPRIGR